MQEQKQQKQQLRSHTTRACCAVLVLFAADYAQSGLFWLWRKGSAETLEVFLSAIQGHTARYFAYRLALYLLTMGSAWVVGKWLFRQERPPAPTPLGRPGRLVWLIPVGLSLCTVANLVTVRLLEFLGQFGIYAATSSSPAQDGTVVVYLLNLLVIAVVPALLEEGLFRGVVLSALRPAGDRIAVLVSAGLFGLIHTSIRQTPFAFLVGLVLGYLVVKTNRLWPAICIHGLNNALSVTMEYFTVSLGGAQKGTAYIMGFLTVLVCGILALCVWLKWRRAEERSPWQKGAPALTVGQRWGAVLSSPSFLFLVGLTAVLTLQHIRR